MVIRNAVPCVLDAVFEDGVFSSMWEYLWPQDWKRWQLEKGNQVTETFSHRMIRCAYVVGV
jgi:hypothetical protein